MPDNDRRESMAVEHMSPEELDAYSIGLSDAYANVFLAFAIAFDLGQDIHDLRERISAQWNAVRATQAVRGAL